MVNFYHQDDPAQHCCEVQFVLQALLDVRQGQMGGHKDFAKFRSSHEVSRPVVSVEWSGRVVIGVCRRNSCSSCVERQQQCMGNGNGSRSRGRRRPSRTWNAVAGFSYKCSASWFCVCRVVVGGLLGTTVLMRAIVLCVCWLARRSSVVACTRAGTGSDPERTLLGRHCVRGAGCQVAKTVGMYVHARKCTRALHPTPENEALLTGWTDDWRYTHIDVQQALAILWRWVT